MKRLFLFLCLTLIPGLAEAGETYWVSTTGSTTNCTTMQTEGTPAGNIAVAINCANASDGGVEDGDIVRIKAGTYTQAITPFGSCGTAVTWPVGTSFANGLTVMADTGAGTAIIRPAANSCGALWVSSSIQYLTIQDLVFDGTNIGFFNLVTVSGSSSNIRFTSNEFKNSDRSGLYIALGSTFVTITGGSSHDNGTNFQDHGFYVESSDNTIDGVEIYANMGYGVHNFRSSSSTSANRNTYKNNLIYGNGLDSVNGSCGMILAAGSGNVAYNNIIRDHTSGSGTRCGILVGIAGSAASSTLVYGNTVQGNPASQLQIDVNSTGLIARNNALVGTLPRTGTGSGTPPTALSNNIESTTGNGSNGQPLFVNISTNDFHPTDTSSLVGAGIALGVPYNVDREGISRPQGTMWDVGAYEYISPPASLTLLSPNGGQIFAQASSQTVQWSSNGAGATVELTEDQDGNGTYETTISASTANDGGHNYTVSGSANANRKMKVKDTAAATFDVSDGVYEVTASSPGTITFSSPTSGLHFLPGQTIGFSYSTAGISGNLVFYISYNNGTYYQPTPIIASHPVNQPDATWIASGPSSTTAKFKACSLDDPSVCGESAAVKIAGTYLSIR